MFNHRVKTFLGPGAEFHPDSRTNYSSCIINGVLNEDSSYGPRVKGICSFIFLYRCNIADSAVEEEFAKDEPKTLAIS